MTRCCVTNLHCWCCMKCYWFKLNASQSSIKDWLHAPSYNNKSKGWDPEGTNTLHPRWHHVHEPQNRQREKTFMLFFSNIFMFLQETLWRIIVNRSSWHSTFRRETVPEGTKERSGTKRVTMPTLTGPICGAHTPIFELLEWNGFTGKAMSIPWRPSAWRSAPFSKSLVYQKYFR